jgi:hypothetical protein
MRQLEWCMTYVQFLTVSQVSEKQRVVMRGSFVAAEKMVEGLRWWGRGSAEV